jgi:hypothetical protein
VQLANSLCAADDIAAGVGFIGFADVGQGSEVAEDVDGLLELGKVVRADQPAAARPLRVSTIRKVLTRLRPAAADRRS